LTNRPLKTKTATVSFKEAEKEIFDSLRSGRCYITNFSIGDGRGFQFWVEKNGKRYPMGSRISEHDQREMIFYAEAPHPGQIRLIRNGRVIKLVEGNILTQSVKGSGVFRIEVFRKRRGWIYSNPIVVTESKKKG
jgi:hypothetical protein